jgi:hypothetical protein
MPDKLLIRVMVKFQKPIFLIIIVLFSLHHVAWTQTNNYFTKETNLINLLTDSLKKITADSSRLNFNKQIELILDSVLVKDDSFSVQPNVFKHMGLITAPNKKFRIITWNVPLNNGKHKYFGRIQLKPVNDSICKLIPLLDSSKNYQNNITEFTFNQNKWYGTLYYEIISEKIGNIDFYILLGIHFNDLFTNRKIIESMYFNEASEIIFGAPIFVKGTHPQKRVVFDYTINAVMSLKYDERQKMIVFDHLAPPSPLYTGNYTYYGPDFTYDGFKFENNKWVYYPNINFHK